MKKIYIFFAGLFLLTIQLKAQVPNQINYQGVARDVTGLVLPNQAVGLRFSVHQGSTGGTIVYQETQSATTNLLGLFTVAIGTGTPSIGTFTGITWSGNTEYLQVEMDPTGGSSYLNMGTSQFLSVPYALSSGSGWNLTGNSSTGGTDYVGTSDANDVIFKAHNNEVMRIATTTKNVGIGNPSPDASAALDITSSSQGLLMPRMATAPASPALGLMYFNTTTGCFMFYNGTSWQAVICGCPNPPATPGTITSSTGSGNFCPGATGVIYSVAPLNNVTSYTWSVPTGATITSGQGSNIVTLTEGTTSSAISVTATNNCSTGAANSLTLTVGAVPAITTQPANTGVSCLSGGTATFTIAATNASTYQWKVNSGSGFSNVSNGGFYSGATTTTLSVINPTSGMNGYQYECVATGACGSTTSNAATLTAGQSSVPIVISNSTGTATSANLAVKLIIDFTPFTTGKGLNANLNNLEFTTGPGGSGTPLYAWIEGLAPTAGTSTEAVAPTSSSSTALVWVNMGSTTIPASGSVTIYMSFLSSAVMVASTTGASTGYTGMAPQLTGTTLPTYGQYDNGVLVFPSFYDNFAGTTLASKWTNAISATYITVNNGLAIAGNPANWWAIYTNTFSSSLGSISDAYFKAIEVNNWGACINTNGVDAQLNSGIAFGTGGTVTSNPNANATAASATPVANTFYVLSFSMLNTPVMQLSYGLFENVTGTGSALNKIAAGSHVGLGVSGGVGNDTGTYQWFRIRSYPPNGVAPTGAVGTYGCY